MFKLYKYTGRELLEVEKNHCKKSKAPTRATGKVKTTDHESTINNKVKITI